jgi:hypothetical protein
MYVYVYVYTYMYVYVYVYIYTVFPEYAGLFESNMESRCWVKQLGTIREIKTKTFKNLK